MQNIIEIHGNRVSLYSLDWTTFLLVPCFYVGYELYVAVKVTLDAY